jgi:uncharacterized membrane protein
MAFVRAHSRHWNFYIATAVGLATAVVTFLAVPDLFPAIAASLFSLIYLALTARDLRKLTPDYLREHAGDEDAPPWVVFALTLGIVAYVMIALFMVVNDPSPNPLRLVLGAASVVLSWLMINTMWGMHYAWEYYEQPDGARTSRDAGGLKFGGDEEPDGGDFIYFSLVIAMTAQTSDTNVTSRKMRRLITAHSLFSYLFNTVMVAAAVNIVVTASAG